MRVESRRPLGELQHVVQAALRIKPQRLRVARDQERHAVVNLLKVRIRVGRYDDTRLELLAGRRSPPFPQAREREQRLAERPDEMRPLAAAARLAPLVETACGNQATAALPRFAKRRLRSDAVETRVDELPPYAWVFRPERDQAPLQRVDAAPALVLA